jgi:hypothetical protein
MKKDIKKVLDALLYEGSTPMNEIEIFKKVFSVMQFSDVSITSRSLITWQKIRGASTLHAFGDATGHLENKMLLDEIRIKRFRQFFKYVPQMAILFELKGLEVHYQKNLTAEEIKEIQQYVHENHKIRIHGTNKTPWV